VKVLFLQADNSACGHYRMEVPVKALRKAGYEADILDMPKMYETRPYDIVVIQRQYNEFLLKNIELWHEVGIKVVYESDDLVTDVPHHNPAAAIYNSKSDTIEELLRNVDGIVVSTEPLADVYKNFSENVLVAHNHIDLDFWNVPHKGHDRLTIGWWGGGGHWRDINLVQGVIEGAAAGKDYDVLFAGHKPRWYPEKWSFQEWVEFDESPGLITEFDIGLAPIEENQFNNCKSAIKFLEYAVHKTPCVASDWGPYWRVIEHGETGFLAHSGKDWVKCLRRLVNDDELRIGMGNAANEWMLENRCLQNRYQPLADDYMNFFESLKG
jgi:O-antigen biosynthesis protein